MITRFCMSESETTSDWNLEVIRDDEAGRRGARWHRVTFTLDNRQSNFNNFLGA